MSKRGYISRYLYIVQRLKSRPYVSFEELQSYLDGKLEQMHLLDDTLTVGFSKRTLQRDIREIRNLFGIDIGYSRTNGGYFITPNEMDSQNFERMIESIDLFNSLKLSQDLKPYIHLENQKPLGTENLYGLLHAIKNRLKIRFSYKKYEEAEESARHADPYALKEFKHRWYLIANDLGARKIKCFGLDRMTGLEITNAAFDYPESFRVEDYYRHYFGIFSPDDSKPEEVILSFYPEQGNYIKSMPLHASQEILVDDDKEFRIKLFICVTFDFIMQLLSYGDYLKVLSPDSLVKKIREEHRRAFKLYNV